MSSINEVIGVLMLVLLGALVVVKTKTTGSVVEKPKGPLLVQLVNGYNLFFLLVISPAAAVLMIAHGTVVAPAHFLFGIPWLSSIAMGLAGMIYVTGFGLMIWALNRLNRNYQLGGSAPRESDQMVTEGPYRLMRHPMYTAALAISLGLAGLTQSAILFAAFGVYLLLILALIPVEESGLQRIYQDRYRTYRQKTRKLVPLIY